MAVPTLPDPLPDLPHLDAAIALDVYAHKSLHYDGKPVNEEYGDNARLALLGESILNLAITQALFAKKPIRSAGTIVQEREAATSNAQIHQWVDAYGMKKHLAFAPQALEETKTQEASRFLLTSYLGAVYYRRGLSPIQAWIDRLIDPDGTPAGPQQPPNTPPALPHSQIHHSPQNNSLSAFNQQCGQIGYSVEWPAESNGPAHALRWSVKCMVNSVERGRGSGRNMKAAKEEAAKVAAINLGFPGF